MTGPTWPDLLTIHVTADDIASGDTQACASCPIALAARRALGIAAVEVGYTKIAAYARAWDNRVPAAEWQMPPAAREFTARFDDARPVKPFTFVAERTW